MISPVLRCISAERQRWRTAGEGHLHRLQHSAGEILLLGSLHAAGGKSDQLHLAGQEVPSSALVAWERRPRGSGEAGGVGSY